MVSVQAMNTIDPMDSVMVEDRPRGVVAALTGVTKRYGAMTALDGLSLALRPGEVLALLGPNGAGKSTSIRCLLGLIAPTSGTARVFGQDPRNAFRACSNRRNAAGR